MSKFSFKQNNDFAYEMFGYDSIDKAISFLAENYGPGAIFDKDDLASKIQEEFNPGDLFTGEQLTAWALDNGFIQTEDLDEV